MYQCTDIIIDPNRNKIKGKRLFSDAFDYGKNNNAMNENQGTPSTIFSQFLMTPDKYGNSERKVIYYKAENFNLTDIDEKEFSFGENTPKQNEGNQMKQEEEYYQNAGNQYHQQ